jgi:two-component system C4-dicarboxylate transport sensor histidine kinase DctB
LEQVLVNIILNALDAMADGPSPRMEIRAGRQDEQCFISVSDNGHGITPQDLDHLFDPFFTTKPVGKGTGLGLAISYRLIRSQGGTIEVESQGKGATFTIRLPAAEDASTGGR